MINVIITENIIGYLCFSILIRVGRANKRELNAKSKSEMAAARNRLIVVLTSFQRDTHAR